MSDSNTRLYTARAKQIYKNHGSKELAKRAVNFATSNPIKLSKRQPFGYQENIRVDNDDRWRIIKQHLSDSDYSALDIGCKQGVFTNKLSNELTLAMGMDYEKEYIEVASARYRDSDACLFTEYEFNPESVAKIPKFDVILLLTVYHHWTRDYGHTKSKKMLEETLKKCDKLFFEIPDRPPKQTSEEVEGTWKEYLSDVIGEDGQVELIGTTDYMGEERDDLLFLIKNP